ncbi:MAG: hypothetical protein KDK39_17470 [Leptospiraceae bacterium]|nr:hypothetical protein [Leptospiraceae bacterium]
MRAGLTGLIRLRYCAHLALPLLLVLSLTACDSASLSGDFGWARVDDRGIEDPERSLLIATEFRLQRENLYFYDYETIWWTYQIKGSYYNKDEFLAALYENNNTPAPVLYDLRRLQLARNDCCDMIRQKYADLRTGRYLLKIAYKSAVFDQVEFRVVPPEGPRGLIEAEDPDENRLEFDDDNLDEIELYSGI